jgi:hypothetical protein
MIRRFFDGWFIWQLFQQFCDFGCETRMVVQRDGAYPLGHPDCLFQFCISCACLTGGVQVPVQSIAAFAAD